MKPRTKIIDKLFVHMKGGAGGNGLPKLNGIGGKGGDVWITAKESESPPGQLACNCLCQIPTEKMSSYIGIANCNTGACCLLEHGCLSFILMMKTPQVMIVVCIVWLPP